MHASLWEKERMVHNGECPYCLEDFEKGERIWRLPCAHAACEECTPKYLVKFIDPTAADADKDPKSAYKYAECPYCRAPFDPEEKKAAELAEEADRNRRGQESAPH